MKTKYTTGQGTEGSALLAALLVVMTVGVLSATTIQIQIASLRQQETANDRKRAFYLAEAGLSEALLSLRQDGSGQVGTEAMPAGFGQGFLYTSAVEDAHGNFIIHSTGIAARARHRLGLSVERQVLSPGSLGFFGDEALEIGGGTQLTYADSADAANRVDREGLGGTGTTVTVPGAGTSDAYKGTVYPDGAGPRFGGNGTIDVDNLGIGAFTNLQGDVVRGPSSDLNLFLGATVTGSTAAQEDPVELPALEWPTFTAVGSVSLAPGTTAALASNEAHFPDVSVSTGSVLRIVGPFQASMDTLTIQSGATLEIDSSAGPVELHISESLHCAPSSLIKNLTLDAGGLHLLVHGDDSVVPAVHLEMVDSFYGVLYAPLAAVSLPRGIAWTGAAVARTLEIPQNGNLIFDSAVFSTVGAKISYTPISWNLLPVPRDVANPVTYNPGATYTGLGFTAEFPADARQAVEEVVTYEGWDGQEYVYRGVAGGVDLDLVSATLSTIDAADPRFPEDSRHDGVFVQQ